MSKNNNRNHNILTKIRSGYIFRIVFSYVEMKRILSFIKYNKSLLKKYHKSLDDYTQYFKISFEMYPKNPIDNIYLNVPKNEEKYYHVDYDIIHTKKKNLYFIKKFIVGIDVEIKSLFALFKDSENLKRIKFIKFNRPDIESMCGLFYKCVNLEEIDFSCFNTSTVKDMSFMFYKCYSL